MQIENREVTSVIYPGPPMVNAYVAQLPGDCKKTSEPGFRCECNGNIVVARFMEKRPVYVKGLVPADLEVDIRLPELRDITGLAGLEALAKQDGYDLRTYEETIVLYHGLDPIATYCMCGFKERYELLDEEEPKKIADELILRVDEVYEIAETKPLVAALSDATFASIIDHPLARIEAARIGGEAAKTFRILRRIAALNRPSIRN